MAIEDYVGLAAAAATSFSYLPQVKKAWPRGSTSDLSWRTLVSLSFGLSLWILYGFIRGDKTVLFANVVGIVLSGTVLAFKLRDMRQNLSPRATNISCAEDARP